MPPGFYISAFHPKALNICFDLAGLLAHPYLIAFPFFNSGVRIRFPNSPFRGLGGLQLRG